MGNCESYAGDTNNPGSKALIEDNNPHSSVRIRSEALKKDRKDAGFTQSAFSAACRSVSLSTVRRAEQGYRVTEPAAKKMAQILDRPVERYIVKPDQESQAKYVAWLADDWTWICVDIELNTTPRITSSEMRIRQSGGQVVGEVINTAIKDNVVVESFDADVINNVVSGVIFRKGSGAASGMGTICCLAKRHNSWLEGYFSCVNQDGETIESIRFIAVRRKNPDFDRSIREAKSTFEREISTLRVKKLLEAGFKLDDAITMLAALREKPHHPTPPRR